MAAFLLASFYVTMVGAGLIVEFLFDGLGLIPSERDAKVVEASVTWNYTTVLNLLLIAVSVVLVVRFLRTGGPAMLRMMKEAPTVAAEEAYTCPMHPEVISRTPGRCPECGMPLVPR